LWRGEITLGYTADRKRARRKISGNTKAAMVDKRRDLHLQPDKDITPKAGYTHYTVRQAAEDWLAHGLDRRSSKTVKKNQNVLQPILTVIGARKLRELTAADVRQALAAMAARYSSAAVSMGAPGAQAGHPARRSQRPGQPQRRRPGRHPTGQQGRRSKSLALDQAVAVITGARTLPVMELRPGLKDVRRPAALMHAYIVLSLLAGIRTEEARALRWAHVDLDGDPAVSPPVPPHMAVWRSVRVHGETKTERSRRILALPAVSGLHRSRHGGRLDTPRAPHLIRQPDEPPRRRHRGNRPPGRAPLHPHHRNPLPPRTTTRHHHRRRDHGRTLHSNLTPHTIPAPPTILTAADSWSPDRELTSPAPQTAATKPNQHAIHNATIRRSRPVQLPNMDRSGFIPVMRKIACRSSSSACQMARQTVRAE
jgi:integrase